MKSKFKAPGTERLILKYDNLLSRCASEFNLRHYTWVTGGHCLHHARLTDITPRTAPHHTTKAHQHSWHVSLIRPLMKFHVMKRSTDRGLWIDRIDFMTTRMIMIKLYELQGMLYSVPMVNVECFGHSLRP